MLFLKGFLQTREPINANREFDKNEKFVLQKSIELIEQQTIFYKMTYKKNL